MLYLYILIRNLYILIRKKAMKLNKIATLLLEDGSKFVGCSFGVSENVSGEIVFNTSMTGYPESLTDPSYSGQLLVLTYPLVGNYGVPIRDILSSGISRSLESDRIHTVALIVSDYSEGISHWNASTTLSNWLVEEGIVGISGVDTRAITKLLRNKGSMKAKILFDRGEDVDFVDINAINQVAMVSCKEIITYNEGVGRKRVVLVDCGVKHNIIRNLISRNLCVIRIPFDYNFTELDFDGLFISNGPGDPDMCGVTVDNIRATINQNKPICGICMGNQLLAKAGGAKIYKLKYGHRSHNQPVRMIGTNNCYITSQNHGFAVDVATLGTDWEALFINMNDGTNEGICHKSRPFFSAQFHPEASSGPLDTEFIFDKFTKYLGI